MNKMLVAVFGNEPAAYEGLSALKELHKQGDISLYATSVIVKSLSGTVALKQVSDEGPVGSALGLVTGSLVGLLGGPLGMVAGASMGGVMGAMLDLNDSDIDSQFVDDVSKALTPGKAAVLADVEETWSTPVDTRIGKLGGLVFRRLRSEVAEDQLVRESAAFEAEMKQLHEELAEGRAEDKAAIQKEIDSVKKKLEVMRSQAQAKSAQLKKEVDAKVASLNQQIGQAGELRRVRLEKRVAHLKSDWDVRSAKLAKANELAKEALLL
jgi:uncharacterized membrane protein